MLKYLLTLFSLLPLPLAAQFDLSARSLHLGSQTSGNQMNAGLDFINSLKNGTAGLTMWGLAQSGNAGILRLSNGTGAGGWDANGAQIYATASDGQVYATRFRVLNTSGDTHNVLTVNGLTNSLFVSANSGTGSAAGTSIIFQTAPAAGGGVPNLTIGPTGLVSLLATLQIQPSGGGNQMNAGLDFINSLKNGTAGLTMWSLAQSGNAGILRLSDGSGSSGWDGNGAQIYAVASTGNINAVSFQIGSYTGGNRIFGGLDFINALKNATGGLTMWALGQSGNKGVLRLSDGSGAGGIDGAGAYVYADGTQLNVKFLNLVSGGDFVTPSGGLGQTRTSTVRNSAGTGTCTLIYDNGILIGGTC
jgi:hypothetical protein